MVKFDKEVGWELLCPARGLAVTAQVENLDSYSPDIVIVGAGGCGLVAALAAARKGARVLVLEKTDKPGGGTVFSSRSIRAAGTKLQRAKGIEDDGAAYARDILDRNRALSDAGLTQRLAQGSGELVDWLADAAQIDFDVGTRLFGHSRRRSHTWKGDLTIVDFLVQAVGRQKNIRILFSMPVLCLATDEHGAVTGVETPSGVIEGRKVILATGGFGASPEFLARYIPKAVDIPFPGHFGSTGDGLGMGMAVGAATENLGAFQPFPTYIAPFACEVSPDVAVLGGILVDQRGRRFVNESQFPGGLGAKMLELPGKHAYEIFDERIFELNRVGLDHVATTGALEKAESAGALAQKLGLDPEGLEGTVREYNHAVATGKDAFGRILQSPLQPPFYGVKVWVALYHTQGGLKVNTDAQVLRPDGTVILNLYAGGGAASGISGPGPEGYLPGNGLLASLGLGKIAGEHAARSIGP